MKKKKSPLKALLAIPIQLLISILIIVAGVIGDTVFWSGVEAGTTGHPAPAFTILGVVLAIGLFIIVSVVAVIVAIVRAANNKKDN